jgi:plastocyanin
MQKGILLGVVGTLALGGIGAGLVIWSGAADVAATNPPPAFVDHILAYAAEQSIRVHAIGIRAPNKNDPETLAVGLSHFREMCITCHGAPGVQPEEFAAGLHPSAPDLASAEVQSEFTDAMLFQAIARGIGSTGMPAFQSTHTTPQIWAIVAFVRRLNKLTPEEKQELAEKPEGEEEETAAGQEAAATDGGEAKPATQPNGNTVSILGFKFSPAKLEVKEGETVEWINKDFVAHTATADDKTFDTGDLKGGGEKKLVMNKKGTFPYSCRYHSSMKGTIVVE